MLKPFRTSHCLELPLLLKGDTIHQREETNIFRQVGVELGVSESDLM